MAEMATAAKQQKKDEGEEGANPNPLIRCGDLILPWLNPQELASAASTCKSLAQLSRLITRRRSSDASRSFENLPIPFHSGDQKNSPPYAYFLYAQSQLHSSQSPSRQPWGSPPNPSTIEGTGPTAQSAAENGCGCGCGCEGCGIGNRSLETEGEEIEEVGVLAECGPSCGCGSECGNRSTQRGIRVKLKIVWNAKKSWCLFADQFIPHGQFVCEYTGELLTTQEARRRQEAYDCGGSGEFSSSRSSSSSALLVVREHLPSGKACLRVNIDATKVGNAARFINHSCDGGNLWTVLVRSPGAFLPRLCFFASRDIREGEELCFSYGESRVMRSNGRQCFCGSSVCSGTLPSEVT